jgi:hypothetical protein
MKNFFSPVNNIDSPNPILSQINRIIGDARINCKGRLENNCFSMDRNNSILEARRKFNNNNKEGNLESDRCSLY